MQFGIFTILANLCVCSAIYHGRRQLFPSQDDMWSEFKEFIQKFNKKYESVQEFEQRFEIFRSNLRSIILHNSDSSQNFTMGLNGFADLTASEFKEKYISGLHSKQDFGAYLCKSYTTLSSGSLPASVDWRSKNAVDPCQGPRTVRKLLVLLLLRSSGRCMGNLHWKIGKFIRTRISGLCYWHLIRKPRMQWRSNGRSIQVCH